MLQDTIKSVKKYELDDNFRLLLASSFNCKIYEKNLNQNGFANTGIKDRGFMDSIYFREPLGLLIELASYKFDPPIGFSHANVLEKAHEIRVKRKALNIQDEDIASAIKSLRN